MSIDISDLKAKTFARAPGDAFFFVCRGDRISNVRDLANSIASLTQDEFVYHVNPEKKKNDSAAWIHHVIGNPYLARDLDIEANLRSKDNYVKTIRDHLAWLENA